MKRISDIQRLINFGYNAEEAELNQAIESLTALRSNRFPKQAKAAAVRKPRKPRTPAASTPPAVSVAEASSSES